MWWDEEREDTDRGMKEEHRIEQEGEGERTREEGSRNGVGGGEWQDGEGERLKVAASEDREQEKEEEQAKSQGESAREVQVIEGETGKENGNAQQSSQEVLHQAISVETTTPSDRQDEAPAGEKSEENTADSCTPAAQGDTLRATTESIHTPLLEDRIQGNTHQADENTHTSSSSAPPGEDGQTPHSERVNSLIH